MSWLIRHRNWLLAATVCLLVAGLQLSGQLRLNQSLDALFPKNDPDLAAVIRSREEFGGNEYIIAAWEQPGLIGTEGDRELPQVNPAAALKISEVVQAGENVAGVDAEKTQDLLSLLNVAPRSVNSRKALLELMTGTLLGKDGRTVAVVFTLIPEQESEIPRAQTVGEIKAAIARVQPDARIVGEPVQVVEMFRLVEQDGRTLYLFTLAVLTGVFVIIFRRMRWVLAAMGTVVASVVVTRAILAASGTELSMVSSMLNSLITVIAVATVMHLVVHYRDLRYQHSRLYAARRTLSDMTAPISWTIVTTIIGFAALSVTTIAPVRSFSLMMSLGTLIILPVIAGVVPAAMLSGSRNLPPASVPFEATLRSALQTTAVAVERHPVPATLVSAVLLFGSLPGIFRLSLETDFSRNFRDESSVVRGLQFVESQLGPAGTWEIAFDTPEEPDTDFLDLVREFTMTLRSVSNDSRELMVLSLTDGLDLPPRVGSASRRLRLMQRRFPQLAAGFYRPDLQRMRIILRSPEQQPAEAKLKQIAEVRRVTAEYLPRLEALVAATVSEAPPGHAGIPDPPGEDATGQRATGIFVMLAQLIRRLLQDQLVSFGTATVGIFTCMAIAFRSIRLGFISLLPNIFPVAVLLGLLGWSGVRVNIGTAMIASVSMGLSVDSTIHYITAFRQCLSGCSREEALRRAHDGAGRAVVLAHLALIPGFVILAASHFIPLVYFGILLSLALIGGLYGDLVLLPLMLRWLTPKADGPQRP